VDELDRRRLVESVASCGRSHASFVDWLLGTEPIDPARDSLLPGWTVGHVLTHVARNADSHVAMLDGFPQYPSAAARDADIEAGARRAWDELVDDVAASTAVLDARWVDEQDWEATATMLSGPRPRHLLPVLRQREVEVHRFDLGLGHRFEDMPADYVRHDLRLMEMLWRARKPMGLTPLPEVALRLPPAARLAWLVGRRSIDGLAPAGLF
jgi:maleylpyruvate isomerase